MQFAFLPIYYEFSMLFEQFFMNPPQSGVNKNIEPAMEDFFQNKALANEMLSFFENLPRQFKNFLCLLHELIKQSKNPNDHAPSSTALRGLLKTANFFKDLFYLKNQGEKYNTIPHFSQLCLNYVKVFHQV